MNRILFKYHEHGNIGLKIYKRILSIAVIFILVVSAISVVMYGSGLAASRSSSSLSQKITADLGKMPGRLQPSQSMFSVQFNETGLPTGTEWSVNVSGTNYDSTSQSISLSLPAGTYSYAINNTIHFYAPSIQGHFTITDQNVLEQVNFHGKLSVTGYENLYTKQFDANSSSLANNQSVFPVYGIFDGFSHNFVILGYGNSQVYLVNQYSPSTITSFNGPSSPLAVDYNHNNGNLYVINSTAVFMYNSTGSLLASDYLGSYLISVAYNPINGQVMVGSMNGGLYFLNGATLLDIGAMDNITLLGSQSIAYNSALNQMEVINDSAQNGNIIFLDGTDKPVSKVNATGTLLSLLYNPSSESTYYVSLQNTQSSTYVLNSTGSHRIPGTANSYGLGVSQYLNSILVTNTLNGTVQLINSSTNEPNYVIQDSGVPLIPLVGPGNSSMFLINPMEDALDVVTTNSIAVNVNFREYGLSPSTKWDVTVGGQTISTNGSVIQFFEIPGNHNYSVGPVSGYVTPIPGSFNAQGIETNVTITFSRTYSVSFMESGLGSGHTWSVSLGGMTVSADWNSDIVFSLPNGTYFFSVPPVSAYAASPDSGYLNVNGSDENISLNFSTNAYNMTFNSSGLPAGKSFNLFINGLEERSNGTSFTYNAIPGSYSYYIPSISGYYPEVASGTVLVSDSNVTVNITWLPYLFKVNFTETGLPLGFAWSIHIGNNMELNSSTANASANLPNGTYSYTFTSGNSSWAGGSGLFTVNGSGKQISIHFIQVVYRVEFMENGLNTGSYWSVMVQGGPSSGTYADSTHVYLQNGTYSFTATSSNSSFANVIGHFMVQGSNTSVKVPFTLNTFNVTFVESGLQGEKLWGVYIPGSGSHTTEATSLNITLSVGEHSYAPLSVPGYNSTTGGIFNVVGSNLTVPVNYTPVPHVKTLYNITIFELGLPRNFQWTVTLNNTTETAHPGGFFVYGLSNGTYNLSVESIGPHGKIFSMHFDLKLIVFGTNQYLYVLFYGPYAWLIIDFAVHSHGGFSESVGHHDQGFSVAQDIVASTRY